MSELVRVLIVEDSAADAELIRRELSRADFPVETKHVEDEKGFRECINEGWDVILADYNMPSFGVLHAIDLAREMGIDVPFIVISGTITDDSAVSCIKHGATDYLLKDRMGRLGTAVKAAIRERALARERNEAVAALRESEAKLRSLFRVAPIGIGQALPGRVIGWVNEGLCALTGYSAEELTGRSTRILYPDDREYQRTGDHTYGQIRTGGLATTSSRFLRKDGSIIDVLLRSAPTDPDRTHDGIIFAALDMSALTRANEELRVREAMYRQLFESMTEGVIYHGPEGQILSANPAVERILGIPLRILAGRATIDPAGKAITADGTRVTQDMLPAQRALRDRAPIYDFPLAVWNPRENGYRWLAVNAIPLYPPNERIPNQVIVTFSDVTERKRAEDERILLVAAIEQAQEAIAVIDPQGVIQYANASLQERSGYEQGELVGQHFKMLESDENDADVMAAMWKTIQSGAIWKGTRLIQHKDGKVSPEEGTVSPVRDAAGRVVAFVSSQRDVTHEQQLERQLRQAGKMEAVGRLAGGIAHDFNNILQAIEGYAGLALDDAPADSQLKEFIEEIVRASNRASTLVRQLLMFSRKETSKSALVNPGVLVKDVVRMIQRVIGADVALEVKVEDDIWTTLADPGQIEQVLMNLCVNSRDAMPGGGKLLIEVNNVALESKVQETQPWAKPGEYVVIAVSDTGVGMSRSVQEHIFEPFFTTKKESEGTGLGLATVYAIVQKHKGLIHVYSEEGIGTTFKIYLPAQKQPALDPEAQAGREESRGGTETILLAEDDDQARKLAKTVLSNAGYEVLAAADGDEALALFQQNAQRIHLAILDIVMPKAGGKVVAERIRETGSTVPVLLMSGYNLEKGELPEAISESCSIMHKPFGPREMLQRIRLLLGGPGTEGE